MLVVLGGNLSEEFNKHFAYKAYESKVTGGNFEILPTKLGLYRSNEPLCDTFPNGLTEEREANEDSIRDQDIVIVQSASGAVGDCAMQILLAVRTFKRNGAKSVTVAMPFAPFGRQDRSFDGRLSSVGADDFAALLKFAGADRIITSEPHSQAGMDFYTGHFGKENVTFLSSSDLFAADIVRRGELLNIAIGAPDGADKPTDMGMLRAQALREAFARAAHGVQASAFGMVKKHDSRHKTRIEEFHGDVRGKVCDVVDDMTDSGGTLTNAAIRLKQEGASKVIVTITDGLLKAQDLLKVLSTMADLPDGTKVNAIDHLVVTDAAPGIVGCRNEVVANNTALADRMTILSVAQQYYDAIQSLKL